MATNDVTRNLLSIGGLIAAPSGEDSWLTFTFPPSLAATYVGNDGQMVPSISPDRSAQVEVTCSPYSDLHQQLGALLRRQEAQAQAGAFDGFPFSYLGANGDRCDSARCFIEQAPAMNAQRSSADVTWQLRLGECTRSFAGSGAVFTFSLTVLGG